MKKLSLILRLTFALLVLCASAKAQVATVSGSLKDLGLNNANQQNTYVLMTLANYQGIPRVTGTNTIVSASVSFKPDVNGNISGSIQENSSITASGQTGLTFYRVCVYFQGTQFQCNNFIINANFNLNTATPTTTSALPLPPSMIGLTANLPLPCTTGQVYFATDATPGLNLYFCLSGVWTATPPGATGATGPQGPAGPPLNLAADNTFTNNDRFKGPIPWRDVTAYMPSGGCSSTTPVNGADTTGTISSGATSLSLASARDFKNGCGIAVLGAGPTSALAAPTLSANPTSASRSGGTTVTMVFTGAILSPTFGSVGMGEAVSVTGCSVAAYNVFAEVGSLTVSGGNTTITYTAGSSATDSATSCLATFIYGSVHGVAGSTTYKYQLVKCDINEGCSPASSTLTIASANATLTKNNYNYIAYPFDTSAAIWLLYSDKGLGGALTCVNASVSMAMIDIGGQYNPCPPYAPTNPPGAATAQTLFTTISSGGGTTTLTLANAASNNATTQNVYHDESSFLNSCITDANNDQPNTGVGGAAYGCYIPAGTYGMNGPLKTATAATNGFLNIYVAGLLNFQTQPWQILKAGYQIIGVGGGAQGGTVGQKKPMTAIKFGPALPYGFVFGTASFQTSVKGFQMQYVNGTGIFIGATNPSNGTSGVSVEDVAIVEQGSAGNAPCVTIDDDNIGIWLTNVSCQANQAVGGMPCVYVTHTPSGSFVNQILRNNGVHCTFHAWKFDGPGGQAAQAAIHDIMYQDSFSENLPNADIGEFQVDGQVNGFNSGGWALQGISLDHLISSDASTAATFVQMSPTSANNMPISAVEIKNSYLNGIAATCAVVTNCQQYPVNGVSSLGVGFAFMPSGQNGIVAGNAQDTYFGTRLGIMPGTANYGANPATDMPFKIYLVPPGGNNINSTGAGSLAAGVYCGSFTGLDANSLETAGTSVICQTVGASASIKYDFNGNGNAVQMYSGYNFYYCFTASGTCSPGQKFSSISTSSDGGNGLFFTFTTTAGSSAATPPNQGAAMFSWLAQSQSVAPFSCFYCASSNSDFWPIGIGMLPTANSGYNLYTKLGVNVGGKLSAGLVANAAGLQIFNTTTSCTTAATAFVTCTTAAISLPVAEADTSYRLVCTPHGPTNFPILVGTTISSATQFTITIEATTAAAATFSSYDCVAGHN